MASGIWKLHVGNHTLFLKFMVEPYAILNSEVWGKVFTLFSNVSVSIVMFFFFFLSLAVLIKSSLNSDF